MKPTDRLGRLGEQRLIAGSYAVGIGAGDNHQDGRRPGQDGNAKTESQDAVDEGNRDHES